MKLGESRYNSNGKSAFLLSIVLDMVTFYSLFSAKWYSCFLYNCISHSSLCKMVIQNVTDHIQEVVLLSWHKTEHTWGNRKWVHVWDTWDLECRWRSHCVCHENWRNSGRSLRPVKWDISSLSWVLVEFIGIYGTLIFPSFLAREEEFFLYSLFVAYGGRTWFEGWLFLLDPP